MANSNRTVGRPHIITIYCLLFASGRTVVATIHQPSAAVFEMFDDLILLKKGVSHSISFITVSVLSINIHPNANDYFI